MTKIAWIGLDWGTSNLRAFAVDKAGEIVEEKTSDRGMGRLEPHQFEPTMMELIDSWLVDSKQMSVFACGMVGARQGWFEAEYREVPCPPVAADGLTIVPTIDQRVKVHFLPGLSQQTPSDVMRGEETQIAGFLTRNPTYHGSVCLPGTHSKWVRVKDGAVRDFATFMTGEMFDILSTQSVLKHSVATGAWDCDAFLAAALKSLEEPHRLAADLFGLRAGALLSDLPPQTARAQLSGSLIGQELGLARRFWENEPVVLIGSSEVVQLYSQVLYNLGRPVHSVDAKIATLSGLSIAALIEEVVHA